MTEPLLYIAAVFLALIAGAVGGYFCGRHDERVSPLYLKLVKSRYQIELKANKTFLGE